MQFLKSTQSLQKMQLTNELFNKENKNFTIRKGIRDYVLGNCILVNNETNEEINITITEIQYCKLNEINKFVNEDFIEYKKVLDKFYEIELNDDVTIVKYVK